jgi:hypothetical protein
MQEVNEILNLSELPSLNFEARHQRALTQQQAVENLDMGDVMQNKTTLASVMLQLDDADDAEINNFNGTVTGIAPDSFWRFKTIASYLPSSRTNKMFEIMASASPKALQTHHDEDKTHASPSHIAKIEQLQSKINNFYRAHFMQQPFNMDQLLWYVETYGAKLAPHYMRLDENYGFLSMNDEIDTVSKGSFYFDQALNSPRDHAQRLAELVAKHPEAAAAAASSPAATNIAKYAPDSEVAAAAAAAANASCKPLHDGNFSMGRKSTPWLYTRSEPDPTVDASDNEINVARNKATMANQMRLREYLSLAEINAEQELNELAILRSWELSNSYDQFKGRRRRSAPLTEPRRLFDEMMLLDEEFQRRDLGLSIEHVINVAEQLEAETGGAPPRPAAAATAADDHHNDDNDTEQVGDAAMLQDQAEDDQIIATDDDESVIATTTADREGELVNAADGQDNQVQPDDTYQSQTLLEAYELLRKAYDEEIFSAINKRQAKWPDKADEQHDTSPFGLLNHWSPSDEETLATHFDSDVPKFERLSNLPGFEFKVPTAELEVAPMMFTQDVYTADEALPVPFEVDEKSELDHETIVRIAHANRDHLALTTKEQGIADRIFHRDLAPMFADECELLRLMVDTLPPPLPPTLTKLEVRDLEDEFVLPRSDLV